ncbi:MAG: translocation/assembly module TamB domain-containing protein [Planctomycetota bacterium]|jgi:hypothetical protein
MNHKNGKNCSFFTLFTAALVIIGLGTVSRGAETCVENESGPEICVSFDGAAPVLDFDFRVDYATDPSNPSVELIAGNLTWNVRSDNDGDPGAIGSITIDPTEEVEAYGVSITDGNDPGAKDVASIILAEKDWTGYSNITDGDLSGNLTGDLKLVQDGQGNGGDILLLVIDGDVSAKIDVPVITGDVYIVGEFSGDFSVTDGMKGGLLWFGDDVLSSADVRIANLKSYQQQTSLLVFERELFGDLVLDNGVPEYQTVRVLTGLAGTGSIDLKSEGVAGSLLLNSAMTGAQILNGGNVTGEVRLADGTGSKFGGSATFSGLSGMVKMLNGGSLDGTLTIDGNVTTGGWITISGDLKSSGEISVTGDFADTLGNDDIDIGGDVAGDIDLDGDFDGSIQIDGTLESTGRILIDGLVDGPVTIEEETVALSQIRMTDGLGTDGSITINDSTGDYDANGTIYIGAPSIPLPDVSYDGWINIKGPAEGSGGDLEGTITVVGCHETDDDLDICICGDTNGTRTITQGGCTNQVDWADSSACCPS